MSLGFSVKVYKGERYYIARVPELGITTQGKTKAEARRNLREAIKVHLEAMADYALEHVGHEWTRENLDGDCTKLPSKGTSSASFRP